MNKLEVIKKCVFFEGLNLLEAKRVAEIAVEKEFEKGDTIFQEGTRSSYFYIITNGQAKITKYTQDGKEVIMEIIGACEIMGVVAVLSGAVYPSSSVALSKVSAVLIKKEEFQNLIEKNPALSIKIIGIISQRLEKAHNKLQAMVGNKVEQRIANVLLELSLKMGNTIPFTREEIASMTGTTTETAIRVTSRLKLGKMIRTERGRIILTDKEKLRLIVDGPPLKF